jgi:hypothetical protein
MESFRIFEPVEQSKSTFSAYLPDLEDNIVKDYLYKLHLKSFKSTEITIQKVLAIENSSRPILTNPKISFNEKTSMYSFSDYHLFYTVLFKKQTYEISFQFYYQYDFQREFDFKENYIYINGSSLQSDKSQELWQIIFNESQKYSTLHNIVLRYIHSQYPKSLLSSLEQITVPENNLSALFISDRKKIQLKRFIDSINTFSDTQTSLRFLLNGRPGTGKTQIINAIINETLGNTNVVICNGGDIPVKKLFNFCGLFKPSLLVIDDLDFLVSERDDNLNKNTLGDFLQALDGLLPNNVFVLGSTNDKNLVDVAAQRPGRFDMILDISEIDSNNYLQLVRRETKNTTIIKLFDDDTLIYLRDKKVTGAFIVSLIKQVNNAIKLNGGINKTEFLDYLDLTHRGFYDCNDENYKSAIGFNK